jgi:hypothetical protein
VKEHIVIMKRDKETKNTYRYVAPIESKVQGTIYLRKDDVGANAPETINVQVTYGNEA